ncbi:MAG: DNA-binding protein [Candidatus Gracilibacteria bacterium]|nr:DNA-binding protein [Candidatus Gracilibacteria bacterium]
MKLIKDHNSQYVLRIDKGEDVLEQIKSFCTEKKIGAAFFYGIGATDNCSLCCYEIEKGIYHDQELKGHREIVNLIGNVTKKDGEVMIHAHAGVADQTLQVIGGHVKKMQVSWTCEVFLQVFPGEIKKITPPGKEASLME